MLSKQSLDEYQQKVEDNSRLPKKDLDRVITSFKDRVRYGAEDLSDNKVDSILFEDFFNMREYSILLKCADQLKEDITELYFDLLRMYGYEVNLDDDGGKFIVKFR